MQCIQCTIYNISIRCNWTLRIYIYSVLRNAKRKRKAENPRRLGIKPETLKQRTFHEGQPSFHGDVRAVRITYGVRASVLPSLGQWFVWFYFKTSRRRLWHRILRIRVLVAMTHHPGPASLGGCRLSRVSAGSVTDKVSLDTDRGCAFPANSIFSLILVSYILEFFSRKCTPCVFLIWRAATVCCTIDHTPSWFEMRQVDL